jgi:hypothetical protein
MKTLYTSVFCLLAIIFISSCTDKYTEVQPMNVPVYMDYATLRSSVTHSAGRDLIHPGKIYFKGNYLLIVEHLEGIHILDVSNPANPQNKVFIRIPGCMDIAVKDNSLYADSYVDLVTIDLSDIANPKESGRINEAFPYTLPTADDTQYPYAQVEVEKGVVVRWEVKQEKRELEQVYYPVYYPMYDYGFSGNYNKGSYALSESGAGAGTNASFGKSGSMARFGLYDQYLYIADNNSLYMFDVKNADKPVKAGSIWLNGTIETMFIYDDHLFFGTPNGMLVYSLNVALSPVYVSNFWHTTACDPVVIQDGYAYITLRGGTTCNISTINRLDVVKMSSDYKQYELVSTYNMVEPYGLGIDENVLFICDGSAGLKVYDATDKKDISSNLLATFPDIHAYDVIPTGNYLFAIGNNGFFLYDYADVKNIKQIGLIPIVIID